MLLQQLPLLLLLVVLWPAAVIAAPALELAITSNGWVARGDDAPLRRADVGGVSEQTRSVVSAIVSSSTENRGKCAL